jgi:hypothetical protein
MYLHTNSSSSNEYTNHNGYLIHNGYLKCCKSDNTRKTRVPAYPRIKSTIENSQPRLESRLSVRKSSVIMSSVIKLVVIKLYVI